MCAVVDDRSWSSEAPYVGRPTDSRFWSVFSVAGGKGNGTKALANCGESHTICCEEAGCWSGSAYAQITCTAACPDSQMQALRQACWSLDGVQDGSWARKGKSCEDMDEIAAAKVYIKGRGGNPCGVVMGVQPPPASWDMGMAIFPTKRKVYISGFVDDAPSYECYAQARDGGAWGKPVTLAQVPMAGKWNLAIELAGYSDRPVNPEHRVFDLPEPATEEVELEV